MAARRVLVLGAAGRDFHDFLTVLRHDAALEVVAFTAAQIPGIEGRRFPAELAGPRYPEGIPIRAEAELEALVAAHAIDDVVLSYSDLSHLEVMHLASRALAAGAGFRLLAPRDTMLRSTRPVIALTASRTGCGKSQAARYVVRVLRGAGLRAAVLRHPMPYGDLLAARVQRFASVEDLDAANVTIEEREDYEPHVLAGSVVFAGVDYRAILDAAEREADVIVWDGGNNDLPFVRPDLWITVVDPHRAGHELAYHPGEANLRAADVVLINKVDTAPAGSIERLRGSVASASPRASIVLAASEVRAEDPSVIRGRRVLVIEDGPTLTHGQMAFGAGTVAAERGGAAGIVDPRPLRGGLAARDLHALPAHRAVPPRGRLLAGAGARPRGHHRGHRRRGRRGGHAGGSRAPDALRAAAHARALRAGRRGRARARRSRGGLRARAGALWVRPASARRSRPPARAKLAESVRLWLFEFKSNHGGTEARRSARGGGPFRLPPCPLRRALGASVVLRIRVEPRRGEQ
ncbi:MAG: hypothetical protein M5U28_40285 [Sandaracinaceae bacterium]|nr:hypothetical protein [Sandaracinaceae bacterium]